MKPYKVEDEKASKEKYSEWMSQIIKPAMDEILGLEVVNQLQEKASLIMDGQKIQGSQDLNPVVDVHSIQASLVEMYGCQAGSGLTIQIGRTCFQNLLRYHGTDLGLSEMPFRLLPLSRKIDQGSEILANFFSEVTNQEIAWEKSESDFTWQIRNPQDNSTKTVSSPICMLVRGMLQEAFYWMSSGRTFIFRENCCHRPGEQACTIQIESKPID